MNNTNNPPPNMTIGQGQPHGTPRPTMVPPGNGLSQPNAYNPPRPPEVYTLPDNVNEALTPELRHQFHHDANGRVLFFTAPPLDRSNNGLSSTSAGLGHSAKYLAGREEWLAERKRKREEREAETNGLRASEHNTSKHTPASTNPEGITFQATEALDEYFRRFNTDTEKWGRETGLEGWRERSQARAAL